MKINWKHIYMVLAVGLLASACEVIPAGEREEVIFTPTDPSAVVRSSLLIEYSGWQFSYIVVFILIFSMVF